MGKFVYIVKLMKFNFFRMNVVIDWDCVGDLGIDMCDIGISFVIFFGGNNVNWFSFEG